MDTKVNGCTIKISNIVATTDCDTSLNLDIIKEILPNTEYNPEVYFALIYHITKPKLTVLVNWSGKLIFTGGKSIVDLELAREIFYDDLKRIGFYPKIGDFQIQNIVVASDFSNYVSKDFFTRLLETNSTIIETSRKKQAVFKSQNPKFTALIFPSGKVSILGLKRIEDINVSVELMKKILWI